MKKFPCEKRKSFGIVKSHVACLTIFRKLSLDNADSFLGIMESMSPSCKMLPQKPLKWLQASLEIEYSFINNGKLLLELWKTSLEITEAYLENRKLSLEFVEVFSWNHRKLSLFWETTWL